MNSKIFSKFLDGIKTAHFIGVGGSGMIGLVQILHQLNVKISGSDVNESDPVKLARNLGVKVSINQSAQNIENPDLIVYTAAILQNNPELLQARKSGVNLVERSQLLGKLSSCFSRSVCVSGTHGKTTTTAMIVEILRNSGLDLSAVVGGNLKSMGGYGRIGDSDLFVCEACEYANHFLNLFSTHSVVLNIESDHMEFFKTMENLNNSFRQFISKTAKCVVYFGDSKNVVDVVNSSNLDGKTKISFGFGENNSFSADNVECKEPGCFSFVLKFCGKPVSVPFKVCVPGKHNVLNALAATAMCHELGLNFETIAKGLNAFRGVKRRFELIGKIKGITVIDDYAHHPSEIEATLNAAKSFGFKKIWVVHQPFTYSRTQMFLNQFAKVLKLADRVVLTKILGSREENLTGIKSEHLAEKIPGSVCFQTQVEAANYVLENAQEGDLVLTLGCGDIYKCANIMVFGNY